LPRDVILDGRDPLPVLAGESPSPHRSLYFTFRSHAALRMGDWKIVRTKPTEAWQLFDLHSDAAESQDRAAEMPVRMKELAAEFARWQQSAR
jgi:arylsulfatase A-like enzyme